MGKSIKRLVKKASSQLGREPDQFAKPFDLTGMQIPIVGFLSQGVKEEYFQRDIEKRFNIQHSTTTIPLQRMEKKALICRRVSRQDTRQESVHLMEKTQGLVEECRPYFRNQERELEKNFSEEDIAIFEKILQRYMKEE